MTSHLHDTPRPTLHGRRGWGSVIVEAQLDALGLPYDRVEVGDLLRSADARAPLLPLNPLAQVPVLVLADGTVLTESAAITLHLADASGRDDFVPAPHAPQRAAFLRWLVFLVANVYPTFTYVDVPTRFVADATAAAAFESEVRDYRERLWRMVEAHASAPWFLGERMSALDVYLAVMTRWSPGRDWFAREAPRLSAIALRADAAPPLRATWARHFDVAG